MYKTILCRTHSVPCSQVSAKHSHAYPVRIQFQRKKSLPFHIFKYPAAIISVATTHPLHHLNQKLTRLCFSWRGNKVGRWEEKSPIFSGVHFSPLCLSHTLVCPAYLTDIATIWSSFYRQLYTDLHKRPLGANSNLQLVQWWTQPMYRGFAGAVRMKYTVLQKKVETQMKDKHLFQPSGPEALNTPNNLSLGQLLLLPWSMWFHWVHPTECPMCTTNISARKSKEGQVPVFLKPLEIHASDHPSVVQECINFRVAKSLTDSLSIQD